MNIVLPGTGLLLRSPGWITALAALIGMAGWSLLLIAWYSPGAPHLIIVGWIGLSAYIFAAVVAGIIWLSTERPSSRDLALIQPVFNEAAGFYLRDDLPAAEKSARRLVAVAAGEPGAWRLLGLIHRAQGAGARATRAEQRAQRLEAVRD